MAHLADHGVVLPSPFERPSVAGYEDRGAVLLVGSPLARMPGAVGVEESPLHAAGVVHRR